MRHTDWAIRFSAWQDFAQRIQARASAADNMRHERGWKLAASVGIPRCACSLHNASIDIALTGWCAGNPRRLRVAKAANRLTNDFSASHIAERIVSRAWDRMMKD